MIGPLNKVSIGIWHSPPGTLCSPRCLLSPDSESENWAESGDWSTGAAARDGQEQCSEWETKKSIYKYMYVDNIMTLPFLTWTLSFMRYKPCVFVSNPVILVISEAASWNVLREVRPGYTGRRQSQARGDTPVSPLPPFPPPCAGFSWPLLLLISRHFISP